MGKGKRGTALSYAVSSVMLLADRCGKSLTPLLPLCLKTSPDKVNIATPTTLATSYHPCLRAKSAANMSAVNSNTEVGSTTYDADAERLAKLGHKQVSIFTPLFSHARD